jgi:PAS domain S-box-containing protein
MDTSIPQQGTKHRNLQQIIAGLTEGVLLIEPDQTLAWANEAALAMHGVRGLEELGRTVTEYRTRFRLAYRNKHSLSEGDYPISRVLAGEVFDEVIVDVTRADDSDDRWVHKIRSLVLNDGAGRPELLVLVIQDATERFSAEERFERAFNANPAPAIVCRLSDLRCVKVNRGFLEMTGYSRDAAIGRSVQELDVLEHAEKPEQAATLLREGRTIPQMEASIQVPDGSSKSVIVAGQPIDIGDEACMLFTFIDLEPRKKVEDALRQSEERFATAFKLAPVPMVVSALDGLRFLDVNDAFAAATGYLAAELVGHSASEVELWGSPATRMKLEKDFRAAATIRNLEIQVWTKSGGLLDCLLSADRVTILGQPCVLSVVQDITERKRSEIELFAAIETVMQDTSWFSRTVIEKLAELRHTDRPGSRSAGSTDLTSREQEVLGLICEGLNDAGIAERLGLKRNTVRNHVSTIYGKIDVHSRSGAVVWARQRGFTGEKETRAERTARRRKG